MLFVGIDIASFKHDCCIIDQNGIVETFSIENSLEGFNYLISHLTEPPVNTHIGMEATGIYGTNLEAFLRRNGFDVSVFNPLSIKKLIAATTLRKTKTDRSDSIFLARHMMSQRDFHPDTHTLYHTSELKSLSRFRFNLVKDRSEMKTKCKAAIIVVFPEFLKAFSDSFGTTALAVLSKYPTANDLAKCRTSTLCKLLRDNSRGRFGLDKAKKLIETAKNSIGTYSDTKGMEILYYISQILFITNHIKTVEKKIDKLMSVVDSPITTIPGVGNVLGAMILGEIGNISKFSNPAKLLAFAGLEPSIYESGKQKAATGSMVKRGSPFLRWAIFNAARYSANYCETYSKYLSKKLSEGKHFNVAVSHLSKKLIRVIWTLLSKNTAFNIDFSY